MIYNSREYDNSYYQLPLIEMEVLKDGIECTVQIKNLEFDWTANEFKIGGMLRPGSCAVAAFNELSIKEIRISVPHMNVYEDGYSGITAISEIYVLGRPVSA